MSFALAASRPGVAVTRATASIAARRVAPTAARLAPLRPAGAFKTALTGLCSSFAGRFLLPLLRLAPFFFIALALLVVSFSTIMIASVHEKIEIREFEIVRSAINELEGTGMRAGKRSLATTAAAFRRLRRKKEKN